jgi:hypothetical protein
MGQRVFLRATAMLPLALMLSVASGCGSEEGGYTDRAAGGVGGGGTGAVGATGAVGGGSGGMNAAVTGGMGAAGASGAAGMMAPVSGGAGGMVAMTGGVGGGGMGGMGGVGGRAPIIGPNGESCYEFRNHGQPIAEDTSKYPILPGEQYVCNHFVIPWQGDMEMVSYSTLYDNQAVLHHWLLYDVPATGQDGTFEPCIGTHVLQDAQLVAGWAVGSNDVEMPPDVGLRMPNGSQRAFLLEWHFYNSTPEVQEDGSGIRICLEPKGKRAKTAGMTWLGTEDFNGPAGMPAGQMSDFSGTCYNDSSEPITIFRIWPHMHQWGRNMKSVVSAGGIGAPTEVFNKPFDFNYQISYEANVVLMPGDSITSTCTFHNESLGPVAFGPSSDQEMCYQFAFSYPAGALDNGIISLVGATNTCW